MCRYAGFNEEIKDSLLEMYAISSWCYTLVVCIHVSQSRDCWLGIFRLADSAFLAAPLRNGTVWGHFLSWNRNLAIGIRNSTFDRFSNRARFNCKWIPTDRTSQTIATLKALASRLLFQSTEAFKPKTTRSSRHHPRKKRRKGGLPAPSYLCLHSEM